MAESTWACAQCSSKHDRRFLAPPPPGSGEAEADGLQAADDPRRGMAALCPCRPTRLRNASRLLQHHAFGQVVCVAVSRPSGPWDVRPYSRTKRHAGDARQGPKRAPPPRPPGCFSIHVGGS